MIIYLIVGCISIFYAMYMGVNIVAALFYRTPDVGEKTLTTHSFVILYPAYKAGKELIINLKYMREQLRGLNYSIFVLSQDSDQEIDMELEAYADIFRTKSFRNLGGNPYHYALQYATEVICKEGERKFDSILLLDPDNTMNRKSVLRLIASRENGAQVSLSKRVSKNEDNSVSLFDGLSERINDYMFRRAKNVMKLTPELSGSGMLMDLDLFTEAVSEFDGLAPGMDKQLLINMMFKCEKLNIIFDEEAIVLDEKTTEEESFNRQRLRWFGNQYYNAKKFGIPLVLNGFKRRNLSMIDYAILLWRPPRSFQIAITIFLIPIDLFLFFSALISIPVFSIAALLLVMSLSLFLQNEKMLIKVIAKLHLMVKTSILNGATVLKSQSSSITGTFINTRSKD